MSCWSVGVDLTEVNRIRTLIERYGDRFLNRVFTPSEIEYCKNKRQGSAQSFAARYAAKEAVFKSTGLGLRTDMRWHDIEVRNNANGRPELHLSGHVAHLLDGKKAHVSLSHTGNMAIAMVVVDTPE
ncbi:MAG: holo-ACP synthase [Calditrichota bacterium]